MQYSATFRYIDKDFGFDALDLGKWNAEYDNVDDFILALNCMAIASSQHVIVEFPEVDVRAKNARVTIRAINGQLFYTDINSKNRKDLRVVPVEIVRLIDGRPLEEVFKREEEEVGKGKGLSQGQGQEVFIPQKRRFFRGAGWLAQLVAVFAMLAILSFCSKLIWEKMSRVPQLRTAPQFIPSLSEESDVLRRYADVYVSESREGAMLFELTREGQFTCYEMWYSEERNGFVLIPLDSYPVQVGLHNGQTAMLAGELYLLLPIGDEFISLHGTQYHRHHADLANIGEVLDVKRN